MWSVCLQITVRPHEPRPPRQNFKTNFEISQSQVEIQTMKFGITVLGFDNLWVQAEIKPSSEKFLTIRAKGDGTNVMIPYLYHLEKMVLNVF